jgi:hypothetical protein
MSQQFMKLIFSFLKTEPNPKLKVSERNHKETHLGDKKNHPTKRHKTVDNFFLLLGPEAKEPALNCFVNNFWTYFAPVGLF